jgi:hypothetical protein
VTLSRREVLAGTTAVVVAGVTHTKLPKAAAAPRLPYDRRDASSTWNTRRRVSLGSFGRANDLYALGLLDDALEACDEVIERYGIEDTAGERSLLAKFFWLREANRVEESNVIWDQIWRCIADVPAHVWGVAWQRVDRPKRPCLSLEHLRATAGVPQIDLALGLTPN